jgi:ABC-type dipeptide/oligopeptide/nickel transport system permease component
VRIGGDPAVLYLPENATPQDVAEFRQRMGFDKPLYVQYLTFMKRLITEGDLGTSYQFGQPALSIVLRRLPETAMLSAVAFAFAMIVAIPTGIISAVYRNSLLDAVTRVLALAGVCLPVFWLGIVLIILFAVKIPIFPTSGYDGFNYLILPGITLGMHQMAVIMRLLRSAMIEVLGNDYIRTARAKGLGDSQVVIRHALKNAALPVITVVALQAGLLLAGAVLTETVFAYPGMGQLAVQSIAQRDFAVIQAFVIVVGVIMISVNLVADMLYAFADPRIRLA